MASPDLIESFGLTDRGLARERNEDQFLIADLRKSLLIRRTSLTFEADTRLLGPEGRLLLVADGIGGHSSGDRASAIAVDATLEYVLYNLPWFMRVGAAHEDELSAELKVAMFRCQDRIRSDAAADPRRQGMGTTLTMAYVVWPDMYIVHVGDSRCYLLRPGGLRQVTRDHTLGQQLVESGALAADQAQESQWSRVLWNAIGGGSGELAPEVYHARLEAGDTVLVCTDGLTRHVPDADITRRLEHAADAESACHALVEAANTAGGSDNITVVVARFAGSSDADDTGVFEVPNGAPRRT